MKVAYFILAIGLVAFSCSEEKEETDSPAPAEGNDTISGDTLSSDKNEVSFHLSGWQYDVIIPQGALITEDEFTVRIYLDPEDGDRMVIAVPERHADTSGMVHESDTPSAAGNAQMPPTLTLTELEFGDGLKGFTGAYGPLSISYAPMSTTGSEERFKAFKEIAESIELIMESVPEVDS